MNQEICTCIKDYTYHHNGNIAIFEGDDFRCFYSENGNTNPFYCVVNSREKLSLTEHINRREVLYFRVPEFNEHFKIITIKEQRERKLGVIFSS